MPAVLRLLIVRITRDIRRVERPTFVDSLAMGAVHRLSEMRHILVWMAESRNTQTSPPVIDGIRLDVEKGVVWLRLDRPEAMNAFDAVLVRGLREAMRWCEAVEGLDVLVITGSGKAFSVGGAVEALRRGAARPSELEEAMGSLTSELNEAVLSMRRLPRPVLAAVNGRAGGAGLSLALACDVRIASERSVFDFAFARIGATPDGGMTWFLPRIVGEARATELLIESPIVRSGRALDLGLVSEVIPAAELEGFVATYAQRLAKHPPHYPEAIKRLVRERSDNGLEAHLETERATLLESLSTEAARARILALKGSAGGQETTRPE